MAQWLKTLTTYYEEIDGTDANMYSKVKRIYNNNQRPTFSYTDEEYHPLDIEDGYSEYDILYDNADEHLYYALNNNDELVLSSRIYNVMRTETLLTFKIDYYDEVNGGIESVDSIAFYIDKTIDDLEDQVVKSVGFTWDNNTSTFDTISLIDYNYIKNSDVKVQLYKSPLTTQENGVFVTHFDTLVSTFIYDSTINNQYYNKTSRYTFDTNYQAYKVQTIRESYYNQDDTPSKYKRTELTYLSNSTVRLDTIVTTYEYQGDCQTSITKDYTYLNEEASSYLACISGLNYYDVTYDSLSKTPLDSSIYSYNNDADTSIASISYYEHDGDDYILSEKYVYTNKEVKYYEEEGIIAARAYFDKPELVGLAEKTSVQSLGFYPNPVENTITLEKAGTGTIFTVSGNEVKSFDGNTVDASTLTNGMYMIQLIDEAGQVYTSKFIKK